MGYKLAGFDVIGCNEIDPKMMAAYRANHTPSFSFLEPIQTFKMRDDLPPELFDLDILDGSPPCSSFSMYELPEQLSLKQWCIFGSFPIDYEFHDDGTAKNDGRYIIGMSVPPIMTARLSDQIALQWLDREYQCDTIDLESFDFDLLTGRKS